MRYTVTVDDMVAGLEYHMVCSPAALKRQKKTCVILTIGVALALMFVGGTMRSSLPPESLPGSRSYWASSAEPCSTSFRTSLSLRATLPGC